MTNAACDKLKAEIRIKAAGLRQLAHQSETDASAQLAGFCTLLIDRFQPQCIAGYWPIKTELDVTGLLSVLASRPGITTCLPRMGAPETKLDFHLWQPADTLDSGPYHTKQPFAHRSLIQPDLLLMPLLAFDQKLNRLGYGGGFYDRTLASFASTGHKVVAVGVGYNQQCIDEVPIGAFDQRLDGVLTPTGLYTG